MIIFAPFTASGYLRQAIDLGRPRAPCLAPRTSSKVPSMEIRQRRTRQDTPRRHTAPCSISISLNTEAEGTTSDLEQHGVLAMPCTAHEGTPHRPEPPEWRRRLHQPGDDERGGSSTSLPAARYRFAGRKTKGRRSHNGRSTQALRGCHWGKMPQAEAGLFQVRGGEKIHRGKGMLEYLRLWQWSKNG